MIDLHAIRERLAACSPRPWRNGSNPSHFDLPEVTNDKTFAYYVDNAKDAAFIAHAPDDVAALLDEVKELRSRVLRPMTEDEVVAALHAGRAERRVAEGDNAWTTLFNECAKLRSLLGRACNALDILGGSMAAELRRDGGLKP